MPGILSSLEVSFAIAIYIRGSNMGLAAPLFEPLLLAALDVLQSSVADLPPLVFPASVPVLASG